MFNLNKFTISGLLIVAIAGVATLANPGGSSGFGQPSTEHFPSDSPEPLPTPAPSPISTS
jgi:hypothetical protein